MPKVGSCLTSILNPSCQIAGGDSGIGRAVAVHFAREGADVAILYKHAHKDADDVVTMVTKEEGRRCIKFAGDVTEPQVGGGPHM